MWSTQLPEEEGYFWYAETREDLENNECFIVEVREYPKGLKFLYTGDSVSFPVDEGYWKGPLKVESAKVKED